MFQRVCRGMYPTLFSKDTGLRMFLNSKLHAAFSAIGLRHCVASLQFSYIRCYGGRGTGCLLATGVARLVLCARWWSYTSPSLPSCPPSSSPYIDVFSTFAAGGRRACLSTAACLHLLPIRRNLIDFLFIVVLSGLDP